MKARPVSELKNIGKTVAAKLSTIGITDAMELKKLGAAKIYQWLSSQEPHKRLPVCYYLYSLEGAIQDKHWSELTENEKKKLRITAGLKK